MYFFLPILPFLSKQQVRHLVLQYLDFETSKGISCILQECHFSSEAQN